MNAKELSALIKREVVERFDHRNLNVDVPYFRDLQPSTENFVKVIWDILEPYIAGCRLHSIVSRKRRTSIVNILVKDDE